jgi:hypothetical protein
MSRFSESHICFQQMWGTGASKCNGCRVVRGRSTPPPFPREGKDGPPVKQPLVNQRMAYPGWFSEGVGV